MIRMIKMTTIPISTTSRRGLICQGEDEKMLIESNDHTEEETLNVKRRSKEELKITMEKEEERKEKR